MEMRMGRNSKRAMAWTGAWLASIAVAGCGPGGAVPADAAPQTIAALEACRGESGDAKQGCYEERLLAELDEAGVRPALDMLSDIAAADREVELDAHVYTHAIGIESYDPDRPVGEVFAECTELFQSGCYHGVIQAHFVARGAVNETTVRELCDSFKQPGADRFLLFQCLHGMGHGLVMIHDHHLPRALRDCDLLEDGWDRESCYGGAFMENVVAATKPHHAATELASDDHGEHAMGDAGDAAATGGSGEPGAGAAGVGGEHEGNDMHADAGEAAAAGEATRAGDAAEAGGAAEAVGPGAGEARPAHEHDAMTFADDDLEPFEPLREDDLHYPCSILERRYLTACYMMQTSVMLWFNGNDIGGAAAACAEAPENWRRTCFQSLGRDVSARTLQDPDESLKECGKAPEEYRGWCYTGLVKNFVDLTATFDDGFAFCRLIEDEYKPRCYEAMGEEIGILRATEAEKREACSVSESFELEQRCLYGARVRS